MIRVLKKACETLKAALTTIGGQSFSFEASLPPGPYSENALRALWTIADIFGNAAEEGGLRGRLTLLKQKAITTARFVDLDQGARNGTPILADDKTLQLGVVMRIFLEKMVGDTDTIDFFTPPTLTRSRLAEEERDPIGTFRTISALLETRIAAYITAHPVLDPVVIACPSSIQNTTNTLSLVTPLPDTAMACTSLLLEVERYKERLRSTIESQRAWLASTAFLQDYPEAETQYSQYVSDKNKCRDELQASNTTLQPLLDQLPGLHQIIQDKQETLSRQALAGETARLSALAAAEASTLAAKTEAEQAFGAARAVPSIDYVTPMRERVRVLRTQQDALSRMGDHILLQPAPEDLACYLSLVGETNRLDVLARYAIENPIRSKLKTKYKGAVEALSAQLQTILGKLNDELRINQDNASTTIPEGATEGSPYHLRQASIEHQTRLAGLQAQLDRTTTAHQKAQLDHALTQFEYKLQEVNQDSATWASMTTWQETQPTPDSLLQALDAFPDLAAFRDRRSKATQLYAALQAKKATLSAPPSVEPPAPIDPMIALMNQYFGESSEELGGVFGAYLKENPLKPRDLWSKFLALCFGCFTHQTERQKREGCIRALKQVARTYQSDPSKETRQAVIDTVQNGTTRCTPRARTGYSGYERSLHSKFIAFKDGLQSMNRLGVGVYRFSNVP